jgi:hypothetical protein
MVSSKTKEQSYCLQKNVSAKQNMYAINYLCAKFSIKVRVGTNMQSSLNDSCTAI